MGLGARELQALGWSCHPTPGQQAGTTIRPPPGADEGLDGLSFRTWEEVEEYLKSKRHPLFTLELCQSVVEQVYSKAHTLLTSAHQWSTDTGYDEEQEIGVWPDDLNALLPERKYSFLLPPGSQFPEGVDGKDFFSDRTLLSYLLDVTSGKHQGEGLLTQETAFKILHHLGPQGTWLWIVNQVFKPAQWVVTSWAHAPKANRPFPHGNHVLIAPAHANKTAPGGTEGWDYFLSKNAFYRFCLKVIDQHGGFPPMDTTIRADDLQPSRWPVLWTKLCVQPEDHRWDWRSNSSGSPIFVSPKGDMFARPVEVVQYLQESGLEVPSGPALARAASITGRGPAAPASAPLQERGKLAAPSPLAAAAPSVPPLAAAAPNVPPLVPALENSLEECDLDLMQQDDHVEETEMVVSDTRESRNQKESLVTSKIDASHGDGAMSLLDPQEHIMKVLIDHHSFQGRHGKDGKLRWVVPPGSKSTLSGSKLNQYLADHFILTENPTVKASNRASLPHPRGAASSSSSGEASASAASGPVAMEQAENDDAMAIQEDEASKVAATEQEPSLPDPRLYEGLEVDLGLDSFVWLWKKLVSKGWYWLSAPSSTLKDRIYFRSTAFNKKNKGQELRDHFYEENDVRRFVRSMITSLADSAPKASSSMEVEMAAEDGDENKVTGPAKRQKKSNHKGRKEEEDQDAEAAEEDEEAEEEEDAGQEEEEPDESGGASPQKGSRRSSAEGAKEEKARPAAKQGHATSRNASQAKGAVTPFKPVKRPEDVGIDPAKHVSEYDGYGTAWEKMTKYHGYREFSQEGRVYYLPPGGYYRRGAMKGVSWFETKKDARDYFLMNNNSLETMVIAYNRKHPRDKIVLESPQGSVGSDSSEEKDDDRVYMFHSTAAGWKVLSWYGWTVERGENANKGLSLYVPPLPYGNKNGKLGVDFFFSEEDCVRFVRQKMIDGEEWPKVERSDSSDESGGESPAKPRRIQVDEEADAMGKQEGDPAFLTGMESWSVLCEKLCKYWGWTSAELPAISSDAIVVPPTGDMTRATAAVDYCANEEQFHELMYREGEARGCVADLIMTLEGLKGDAEKVSACAEQADTSQADDDDDFDWALDTAPSNEEGEHGNPNDDGDAGQAEASADSGGDVPSGKAYSFTDPYVTWRHHIPSKKRITGCEKDKELLRKLKAHGWKEEWPSEKLKSNVYYYWPPWSKAPGAVENRDYFPVDATQEDGCSLLRKEVFRRYVYPFQLKESNKEQSGHHREEDIDDVEHEPIYDKMDEDDYVGTATEAAASVQGPSSQEEGAMAKGSESADHKAAMAGSGRVVGESTSSGIQEVDENTVAEDHHDEEADNTQIVQEEDEKGELPMDVDCQPSQRSETGSEKSRVSSSAKKRTPASSPACHPLYYDHKYIMEQGQGNFRALLDLLVQGHGWTHMKGRYLDDWVFMPPRRRKPYTPGAEKGVDYFTSWEEVFEFVRDHPDEALMSSAEELMRYNEEQEQLGSGGKGQQTSSGRKEATAASARSTSSLAARSTRSSSSSAGKGSSSLMAALSPQEHAESVSPLSSGSGKPPVTRSSKRKSLGESSRNLISDLDHKQSPVGAVAAADQQSGSASATRQTRTSNTPVAIYDFASPPSVAGGGTCTRPSSRLRSSSGRKYETPVASNAMMQDSKSQGKRRRLSAVDTSNKKIKRDGSRPHAKNALTVLLHKGWRVDTTIDGCILSPGPNATVPAPEGMPSSFPSQDSALAYAMNVGGLVTPAELQAVDGEEEAVGDEWGLAEKRLLETRALLDKDHESNVYVDVRKEELEKLVNFLAEKMDKEEGGLLHLCGMPGTGKTLCSQQAISIIVDHLQQQGATLPTVIRINGSHHHHDPRSVFQAILQGINPDNTGSLSAEEAENRFVYRMTMRRWRAPAMTILVLDEMDRLRMDTEEGQRVIRCLLETAMDAKSTLVMLGISNTLDQRWEALLPKEHRGLDPNKFGVCFPAYKRDQLEQILHMRLGDRFQPAAVKAIAAHAGAATGDARFTYGLCLQAVDECLSQLYSAKEENSHDTDKAAAFHQVSLLHARGVIRNGTELRTVELISRLAKQQKVLLAVCVHLDVISRGKGFRVEDVMAEYQKQHKKLLGNRGSPTSEFNSQMESLAATGLLQIGRGGQVSVSVSLNELVTGLGELEAGSYGHLCKPITNNDE